MKKIFFSFINILPTLIALLPYSLAYYLVRFIFRNYPIKIWARNSYHFKQIVFGLSDLDLTFYLEKTLNINEIKQIIKKYHLLKKIVPLLGEINLYFKDELPMFLEHANPLEISRDPLLLQHEKKEMRPITTATKIVFVARMLEADAKNLIYRFPARQRKWNFHCHQLQLDLPYQTFFQSGKHGLEGIIDFFDRFLFVSLPSHSFKAFLLAYLKNEENDINSMNRFYNTNISVRDFILLYPSRWLGASLDNNRFQEDLGIIDSFSIMEQEIYCEQIRWEIWGLFLQYRLTIDHINLHIHLGNISKTLDHIRDVETNKLKGSMSYLYQNQQGYVGT